MDLKDSAFKIYKNSIALARQALASRAGRQYEDERDVWKILGYKTSLDFFDYLAMYLRQDVAARIVDMPPQETWRSSPLIVPNDDSSDTAKTFIKDLGEFATRTNLWHWMERVDRVSGIGRYGGLFIGAAGNNKNADALAQPITELKLDEIAYFGAYHQKAMEIIEWDSDVFSPRFGYPTLYKMNLADFTVEAGSRDGSSAFLKRARTGGAGKLEVLVHWTRVLHMAEDTLLDNVHGRPRLERVFNRLNDLLKIAGGSSEMFWQNVAQIFHVNLDPELQYDEDDLKELDNKFLEMMQGLRRVIQTEGVEDIKTLQGGTPDPRGVFSVLKSLIASAAEIPQRILFGSEQGELASTQDQAEWYGRIASRRSRYADPQIIRPFINRLALWGAVVVPEGGYTIQWSSLYQESGLEKANKARSMATAASLFDKEVPDRLFTAEEIREAAGHPRQHPDPDAVAKRQAEVAASKEKALAAKNTAPPNGKPDKPATNE